jgi:hypothetical protein
VRVSKVLATVGLVGGLAFSMSGIAEGSTPTGGVIRIWQSEATVVTAPILVTGAIGDYGKATSEDKNGKPDANGSYVAIKLQKGSFEVNAVALGAKFNSTPPTMNTATCSFSFQATAPATVYNGTGAYAGIKGTIQVTGSFAGYGPVMKNGKCDTSQSARPTAMFSSIMGVGTVSYS